VKSESKGQKTSCYAVWENLGQSTCCW